MDYSSDCSNTNSSWDTRGMVGLEKEEGTKAGIMIPPNYRAELWLEGNPFRVAPQHLAAENVLTG